MKLALSSAALPGRTLRDISRACGPRGLAGIEVELDSLPSVEDARGWRALEAPIVALRADDAELVASPELAMIAGMLEVPVVTPPALLDAARAATLAPMYGERGASLLLGVRTDPSEARAAAEVVERNADSLGIAWEIRPFAEDLSRAAEVLRAGSPHVLHVRLFGGGPEQRDQDGLGIGDVFVQLALARYGGVVAITPSDPARTEPWARWIEGTGPTGCGSRAHRRKSKGRVELDVRPVEPKDRIETVLGTYAGVEPGGTLHLIVDHDPECMHHLLDATQPERSFTFEYVERGPEVWRVDVRRS